MFVSHIQIPKVGRRAYNDEVMVVCRFVRRRTQIHYYHEESHRLQLSHLNLFLFIKLIYTTLCKHICMCASLNVFILLEALSRMRN